MMASVLVRNSKWRWGPNRGRVEQTRPRPFGSPFTSIQNCAFALLLLVCLGLGTPGRPGLTLVDAITPHSGGSEQDTAAGSVLSPDLPLHRDALTSESSIKARSSGNVDGASAGFSFRATSFAASVLSATSGTSSQSKAQTGSEAAVHSSAASNAQASGQSGSQVQAQGETVKFIMKNMIIVIAAIAIGLIIAVVGVILFLYKTGMLGTISRATGLPNPTNYVDDDMKGALDDTVGAPAENPDEKK